MLQFFFINILWTAWKWERESLTLREYDLDGLLLSCHQHVHINTLTLGLAFIVHTVYFVGLTSDMIMRTFNYAEIASTWRLFVKLWTSHSFMFFVSFDQRILHERKKQNQHCDFITREKILPQWFSLHCVAL